VQLARPYQGVRLCEGPPELRHQIYLDLPFNRGAATWNCEGGEAKHKAFKDAVFKHSNSKGEDVPRAVEHLSLVQVGFFFVACPSRCGAVDAVLLRL